MMEMTQQPLPGGLTVARIVYTEPETGQTTEVVLDSGIFVVLLQVLRTWGRERALALRAFSASLVQPELTSVDHARLDHTLTTVERYVAQWDDPMELALAISYEQLRQQQLTTTRRRPLPARPLTAASHRGPGANAWTAGLHFARGCTTYLGTPHGPICEHTEAHHATEIRTQQARF